MPQGTKRKYDERQLQAIGADDTAIVSAGAGSGKTMVLSARYLRLVRDKGYPVDSILALTFTKKATSEMFGRIHGDLSREADGFVREQLENFGNAQISTLDSFCARVARSGCAAWGFSPDFAVEDELVRELADREALRFVLDKRDSAVVEKLIVDNGFERVCRGIFAQAALSACPACPRDFASMPAHLEEFLVRESERYRTRLQELRAAALAPGMEKAAAKYLPLLGGEIPDARSEAFIGLCEALIEIKCVNAGKPFHEESREIKDDICPMAAMAGRALKALPEYSELYSLMDEFQGRVIASKRAANVLSFDDLGRMARQVLLQDLRLRSFYKGRFKSIMVDEFQDDNQLQKDILYLLAEDEGRTGPSVPDAAGIAPGKLFFVGDEKQSIYRFRGADVSVFRRLARELGPSAREIELSMNYRSEPRLIEFFNAVFPFVMDGPEKDFAARYRPIESRSAADGLSPSILRLSYAPLAGGGEDSLDGRECEAWGIAQFIRDSVEGGKAPLLVPGTDGKPRTAEYGDFAILFRTTTHQEKMERFLRLLGLPFSSADLCAFFREAPTNDMYLAMRCALYPDDRGAFAAYLRSPFAKLSDDSTAALLMDGSFGDWRFLTPERAAGLGGDEAEKALQAVATLAAVSAMADRAPISGIVSYLWYEAGYREFLLSRERNHVYLEYFDFLFALADDADKAGRCMAAFIERVELLISAGDRLRDSDPPREEGRGVRLMTIHKAKGLEFPVVIVPGIDSTAREQEGKELVHWRSDGCLTVKMSADGAKAEDFFFERGGNERKEMSLAEQKRLFYVACTRAETHLVFSECEPKNRDIAGTSFRSVLDRALALSGAGGLVETRRIEARSRGEYRRLRDMAGRACPSWETAMTALSSASALDRPAVRREFTATELNAAYAASLGLHGRGTEGDDIQAGVDAGTARQFSGAAFGSLVHALIQSGMEGENDVLPPDIQAIADAQPDPGAFLAEGRAAAAVFLGSELRKRLDGAGWKRTEHAFLLRKEGPGGEFFVNGVIDLIAVADGECVVVDYKTNAERVAGEYDLQMSLYREAALGLTGSERARSFLFYVRAGGVVEATSDPDPFPLIGALSGTSCR